ncbi:related to Protein IMPACT homolog [Saccharomycodes ludwigii]|uniref:Related to Protein IMPACT homolog n=1 Tax=Saccharomycodes ludwigii TaxID=36035 RepID=A0A376B477_9ASCO|nr:related to Protein IMPACT homolog [Saccharomycodes ludwigii]
MVLNQDTQDEIDAIEAIYPELIKELPGDRLDIKVPQHEEFTVQISFPSTYPDTEGPHIVEVVVDKEHEKYYDLKYLKYLFGDVMDSVFHKGQVCVYDFLTELDGVLYIEEDQEEDNELDQDLSARLAELTSNPLDGWSISEPVFDRGSTFVGFACHVKNEEEAFHKLALLKTDNKLKRANHIMIAYRIKGDDNGVVFSDCDDDGEAAAGGRMLHLITLMDAWNVIVAVARWFNGTHIGPDRFKHINSTAREAVIKGGFVSCNKIGAHHSKKKK